MAKEGRAEEGITGPGKLPLSCKLLAARLAYNIIIVLPRRPGEAGGTRLPKLLPLPFKPTPAPTGGLLHGSVPEIVQGFFFF